MSGFGRSNYRKFSPGRFKSPIHKAIYYIVEDIERFFLNPINRLLVRHSVKPLLDKSAANTNAKFGMEAFSQDQTVDSLIKNRIIRQTVTGNKWLLW